MSAITKPQRAVARPLKVLVPLIQDELSAGDAAGLEHYRRAGEMLLEARDQVAERQWGIWLSKNFTLSRVTAFRYMKLAQQSERYAGVTDATLSEAIGDRRHDHQARGWGRVREVASRVPADRLSQERQTIEDEVRLHRELAEQLIDIGYRVLATRLHPDRGGSKEAMTRLNRVRDELKAVAETRRFL